jgi:hypothetical protein
LNFPNVDWSDNPEPELTLFGTGEADAYTLDGTNGYYNTASINIGSSLNIDYGMEDMIERLDNNYKLPDMGITYSHPVPYDETILRSKYPDLEEKYEEYKKLLEKYNDWEELTIDPEV